MSGYWDCWHYCWAHVKVAEVSSLKFMVCFSVLCGYQKWHPNPRRQLLLLLFCFASYHCHSRGKYKSLIIPMLYLATHWKPNIRDFFFPSHLRQLKTFLKHFIFQFLKLLISFFHEILSIKEILQNSLRVHPFIANVSTIQSHTFEQRIWDKPRYSLRITWVHVASLHCLNKIFISNFAYHIFGLIFYKSLGTYCDSYWLIKLVVVHPRAPKENVGNGPLWLTTSQIFIMKLWESSFHWHLCWHF